MRTFLLVVGNFSIIAGSVLFYRRYTKRSEFKPLVDDGHQMTGRVFYALTECHWRPDTDPLKPLYKKLAKIEFLLFICAAFGVILFFFAVVAVDVLLLEAA